VSGNVEFPATIDFVAQENTKANMEKMPIFKEHNGVGMTKDEIAFAMQPFHQLDTAPRKQMGTGLGLPVTKALVDANRARLVLTSEPGVGTSADVIFPAERLFTGSASA